MEALLVGTEEVVFALEYVCVYSCTSFQCLFLPILYTLNVGAEPFSPLRSKFECFKSAASAANELPLSR